MHGSDPVKARPEIAAKDPKADLEALARAFAALREPEQVEAFLRDLCTPAELEAMADRWKVVPLLQQGVPYRSSLRPTMPRSQTPSAIRPGMSSSRTSSRSTGSDSP